MTFVAMPTPTLWRIENTAAPRKGLGTTLLGIVLPCPCPSRESRERAKLPDRAFLNPIRAYTGSDIAVAASFDCVGRDLLRL